MTYVQALQCRECGRRVDVAATHACEFCFGPLEVVYDYDAMRGVVTRERIEAGPPTLWRYADLLPVLDGPADIRDAGRVDLGAGFTPLVPAPRLGAAIGLEDLWIKNDTLNPTGAFKDRVVSVALTAARHLGFDTAACASTGNLAQSVAAHAAASGMRAIVLVPADLEQAKILATAVYGPTLVAVKGTYDDVNRLCGELADAYGWAFVNVNVRPFYAEGSKTIGFEIAEQLGWRLPDQVVAPMASGAMLVKIEKAFRELIDLELVDDRACRVSGAQASGCSPITTAYADGGDSILPVRPDTIAKSLAIGDPADGYYALEAVDRSGGVMDDASDPEIIDGIKLLARTEGIFGETAAGVTIAVLRKLAAQGHIAPGDRTVAVVSGTGLKTTDAVAATVGPSFEITPSLDEFQAALSLQESA
ncbi:MAG: threonine synthase [Actinomycetota bacterium]|nr:threonine synthase [Actinomycetota bacterium]